MWSDFNRGTLPVPDLRNLDIYHEIGLGLDLENIEALSDDDYARLYNEKLTEWHRCYPILPDGRLWPEIEEEALPRVARLAVA
jgi:hypothetical protein